MMKSTFGHLDKLDMMKNIGDLIWYPKCVPGVKPGTKFGVHYLWKYWKKACAELGIDGVDLYGGTRHSTATALGDVCTPEEVKDATGHSSKAFARYFQATASRAKRVTAKKKDFRH